MQSVRIPEVTDDPSVDIALDTVAKGKQALVFVTSKRSAEKTAEDIARKLKGKQEGLARQLLTALSRPTKQCERLAKCASRGAVFHHAGLAQKQRDLIETAFREGKLGVIVCTPTLAYGVNLPSFRTIVKSVKRYESGRGLRWIPVLEYLQYAGRSGRPDFHDDHGEAVLIASSEPEAEELLERYVHGQPEEIYSKLAVEPVLRMHLLALIASGTVRSTSSILSFFERTFWAHQFKDMDKLTTVVDRTLRRLEEWGFITMASSDFVSADELEERGVRPTSLGMRVAQLYLDPLTAHQLILGLGSHRGLSAFAALQLLSSTLEMRPALRVKVKEYDLIQDALLQHHDKLLVEEPTLYDEEYDAFLASVKTALMLHEWTEEKDEPYLLETFDVRPGELKVKLQTADWLLYAMVELCKLLGFKELLAELMKIRVRLEYGVREELLPLLKLKGIGRVRSRQLFAAGFKTVGHLKAAPAGSLRRVLGEKLGQSVREQLEGKAPREQKPEQQASLSGY